MNVFLSYGQTTVQNKYENGNLREIGQLDKNGKQIGEWKYYYESGKIERIEKFENNKMYTKSFWKNGQLSEINSSENGFFFGTTTMFFENGMVWSIKKFKKGQQIGKWKSYHPNGKVYSIENYRNGERINKGKIYHENGIISIRTVYKDGMAIKSKWYRDDGKLWKIETTEIDKSGNYIESVCEREYHTNGKIEKITNYTNGEPKGEWKYYNDTAKLISTEKY